MIKRVETPQEIKKKILTSLLKELTQKFQKSVKRLIPRKYLKSHQNSRAQFNQNYKGQFHQNLKPLTHLSMSPSSIIWNPTFKCSTTILFSRKKRVESQTSLEWSQYPASSKKKRVWSSCWEIRQVRGRWTLKWLSRNWIGDLIPVADQDLRRQNRRPRCTDLLPSQSNSAWKTFKFTPKKWRLKTLIRI